MQTIRPVVENLSTVMTIDDAMLVADSLAGRKWANEAMFRKYVQPVSSLIARLLRHREDTEDAVQDTFIQAFRDMKSLRDPTSLRSWLMRIAVRQVLRKFRYRKLRRLTGRCALDENLPLQAQAHGACSQEVLMELALLDRALDQMAEIERLCWVLKYLEDLTLEETAEYAGVSLATVKRRLSGARAVVARYMEGF